MCLLPDICCPVGDQCWAVLHLTQFCSAETHPSSHIAPWLATSCFSCRSIASHTHPPIAICSGVYHWTLGVGPQQCPETLDTSHSVMWHSTLEEQWASHVVHVAFVMLILWYKLCLLNMLFVFDACVQIIFFFVTCSHFLGFCCVVEVHIFWSCFVIHICICYTVELGCSDLGLWDTLYITLYILWYQLICHRFFYLAQYNIYKSICSGYNNIGRHSFQYDLPKCRLLWGSAISLPLKRQVL